MKLKQFQVDAFASRRFEGNPAAVCPLDQWLSDDLLLAIAEENNLSETAFFVPTESGFHLRWFTPVAEVDFCGHATLGSAHVLFDELGYQGQLVTFETRSGKMSVERNGELYVMNFPAQPPRPCSRPKALVEGLGAEPNEVLAADDYLAVYESEAVVQSLSPDFASLCDLDLRGVIATAPGDSHEFVSRFFGPKFGIDEDPVTGSAHCELTPYWSKRLGKRVLRARQISRRGGDLLCEMANDRVFLKGRAVTFMVGEIRIDA
ncbi:MAG: PhzF family phenazine biosynthesis protein [Betaproteobacteria bacterium]|nr:MAG: PhzF family phenazine biosynthesis protein [Betaproteobacteria bacterium]